jgi:hypothetical protein
MSTRKSDGRHWSDDDVAAADDWYWTSIGKATEKLLARLEKHHARKGEGREEAATSKEAV